MYKILGVYVLSESPFRVASFLTADNNVARKPPTISYMWALCASKVKRLRILEVGVKTKTIGGMKNLLTE